MLGIVLPIGRHVEDTTDLEFRTQHLHKRRLHDTALVMTRFMPRVWEEQLQCINALIGDHLTQYLYRIVAEQTQIGDTRILR